MRLSLVLKLQHYNKMAGIILIRLSNQLVSYKTISIATAE